ncbi:hypothetical protein ACWCQW_55460 [Streptomyces mirabilis]
MTYSADVTSSELDLPDGLVRLTGAALTGNLPSDTRRERALHEWLRTYGDTGMRALARLAPAHLTAVHLYGGPDYRLMKAFLNGERLGARMGRRLLRFSVWSLTRRAVELDAPAFLPTMLRGHPGLEELFDDMRAESDLETPSPETDELRGRSDVISDWLYAQMPLHVDMAIEALEILPPVDRDVWWGDRGIPGSLVGPPMDGPTYGRDTITMPFFRSTSLVRDRAHEFMTWSKRPPAGSHPGLVHVPHSTAREITPFVASLSETEVTYPPGAFFRIADRGVVRGGEGTVSYESITAQEATPPGDQPSDGAALPPRQPGLPHDLFRIGPSTGTVEDRQQSAPVLRPIHGEDGELIGVASFDDADWAVRREEYARLGRATGFVSWERDDQGRPAATYQALPGGGRAGGTFFFASHGGPEGLALVTQDGGARRDDGSYAGQLLRSARGRGFRSVTVLACGPGDVVDSEATARERAKRMANQAGLPVHLGVGRAAVSDALPHLLEDADGRATGWVTEYPDGWSGPEVPAPGAGTGNRVAVGYPASAQINATSVSEADPQSAASADGPGWSVSAWQPAGRPDTVRFGGLYRDREWRRSSAAFEFALAGALSGVPELTEVAGLAVRGLHEALAARNGEERAWRAFFARDAMPEDPAAELERLLALPPGPDTLDRLMTVFTHAAYAGPGLPSEVGTALARRPDGTRGRYAPGSAYRAVHDSRGFRRVGGERGPALRLLRMFAALGLPPSMLPVFRTALTAWMIPADLQSLHEILRASHLIGMGDPDERAATRRDAAGLHNWARDHIAGGGLLRLDPADRRLSALIPPHQAVYGDRMTFPAELTVTVDVPDALVSMVGFALAGTLPPVATGRLKAMSRWLDRYGSRGTEALKRLAPAHITALYVYSGPDYRLMKALLNGERFGPGMGRHLVRFTTWRLVRDAVLMEDPSELPLVLLSHPSLAEVFDELNGLSDLETPSPELSRPRRRLDAIAARLYDDLKLHVDMAIEALEILPPVGRNVWWGDRGAPGPLDRPSVNGPVYGADTIEVPFFRSTSLLAEEAQGFALDIRSVPERSHRKVVRVRNSTAREGAPFFAYPTEQEALYPPGMRFDIIRRQRVDGNTVGSSYESQTVEEATPLPDGLPVTSQADPLPYAPAEFEDSADDLFDLGPSDSDMPDADRDSDLGMDVDSHPGEEGPSDDEDDGTPAVAPASRGDYRRTGPYAAELDGTVFALHESPGEGDRSADTLLSALRYAAPEALQDAGIDTPEAFRDWLGRTVTDADVSEVTVPSLDQGRTIPLSLLKRIGVKLGTSQQTQGTLLGDALPVSEVTRGPEATLSPVQRFQVLMSDPSYAGEGVAMPMEALVGTAVRELGVEVALAGSDGEVTFHGGPTQSAPPALLVRDGDRYLSGLADGPGDTTGESEARLRRVVEAVSSAPVSVRRRLATRQAPDWVRARIRYMEEAERFEERLHRYLGDHEAANAQLGVMVREVWKRAVAAGRWAELGSADPTTDGAVGTDRDRIQAVVDSGNLRERMGLLWFGAPHPAGGLISDLLGTPAPVPQSIIDEYGERLPSSAMTAYREVHAQTQGMPPEEQARLLAEAERTLRAPVRPEDVRPPLSEAERALMPDEDIAWIPGRNRWDYAMSSRFQAATELTSGLVLAGTSGSSQRLMTQAVAMRDVWHLDLDLGLVRIALLAEMLTAGHHSLHEIMRGCQLVFDQLRERGTPESPDLDYIDNWGRYWHIAPLTEAELREHVAIDGFPDEHALDATGRPTGIGSDDASDGPADQEAAAWLAAHRDTLEDVRDVLVALGADIVPDSDDGPLTPDLLERLIDDWFRTRNLEPVGSLAEKLHRILNDRA